MLKETLKKAWDKSIKEELVQHDVKVKNETWRFGIKKQNNKNKYFAQNITKNKKIQARILERTIPGTKFIIQLNEFRALRPVHTPHTLGIQPEVSGLIHDCRFACADKKNPLSLSNRHVLLSLKLKNYTWNFYSNAFPHDTNGHFLIVPSVNKKLPHLKQVFEPKLTTDVLLLADKASGLIIIFQSLHAGASVNHFHLQAFFNNGKIALSSGLIKNNVLENYPVPAFVYKLKKENAHIQKAIKILQEENVPFDLIALNKNVYIFPRNPDHEVVSEFPQGVIGAMDIAGKFITSDRKTYQTFDIHKLYRSLNKTCFEI